MPVKKLAIVFCVVTAGVSVAWVFRKDATSLAAWNSGADSTSLEQPVERRVGSAPWSIEETPVVTREPLRVPTASTIGERPLVPGEAEQPTFHKNVHPVAALLEPIEGIAPEEAERVSDPGEDSDPRRPGALEGERAEYHTVVDGDTLTRLAVRYLGRADGFQEIYELNRDVLRSPDLLPIGARLKIPPRSSSTPAPLRLQSETSTSVGTWEPEAGELRLVPVSAGPPANAN